MIRLRAPTPDDATAVLRVMEARDIADLGAPDITLEDILDQWGSPAFELESDAVVAVDGDGVLIGYAVLWIPGGLAVVDPAREREGAGSALLAWIEHRARESARAVHRQWIASSNVGGRELLERAGYSVVRSYWRLARSLDPAPSAPAPPPGVTIVPLDLGADAQSLSRVAEEAFAGNADYEPEAFRALLEDDLSAHDLDPSLSRVARRDTNLVGFVLCRRWEHEHTGFVNLLGVCASERRQGLGAALLLSAFAAFAAAGLREAQLGVATDNPRALDLYERAGMTPRHRNDVYEKPL